jgi:hypothetical protein
MTQEPPQPPEQPDPQTTNPPPPPEPPTGYGPPSLQELADEFKLVLKDLTINVLRATVRGLEAVIARLEAPPPPPRPTLALPGTAESGASTLPPAAGDWLTRLRHTTQQLSAQAQPLLAKAQPYWKRGWNWWTANALPKIRAALPIALNDKLTDQTLSGAIAALLAVVLITFNTLTAAPPPAKISQVPPPPPPASGEPNTRTQPPPITPTTPELPSPPGSVPRTVPALPDAGAIASPAPSRPPDQPLVAAIQDQVTAITDQYSERLIQSVRANFRSSRLIVTLGDGWYTLSPSTQDKLSTEILKRANKLNFIKLELTDTDGALVARSPVIGGSMIILKRDVDGTVTGSANG